MMRSLWAGVTGLQAHQIAMDVEGNNIANVNTTGFKYSRANFSDLLSQTAKIATAPQGDLGGKNSMQIGLGTQISSVTKIFKQGSIETTDKNTDLAIQGDGFFVVSPDGGKTYKYTRNGDFSFDAEGNFSESNGYIIQGWMRDEGTGEIDSTAPIANITIPPGLTTPANDTGYITLKANLDSGDSVGTKKSPIYSLDQYSGGYDRNLDGDILDTNETHNENDSFSNAFNTSAEIVERGLDMGALFNASGDAFNLRSGQGIWISYAEAKHTSGAITTGNLNITLNGETITGTGLTVGDIINEINAKTGVTGVSAQLQGTDQIILVNSNKDGTEAKMKNIDLVVNAGDATGLATVEVNTAYQYTYSPTFVASTPTYDKTDARAFTTTEDLRNAIQTDARSWVDYTGDGTVDANNGVAVIVNEEGQYQISNPDTATGIPLFISVTGLTNATNGVGENSDFTASLGALQGALSTGQAFRASQGVYAASHASSIDVYDSLGSKHTVRFEFTKVGYTDEGGTEWAMTISVPEPGEINSSTSTVEPKHVVTGFVSFNSDGSLSTYTPTNLTYTANNGSTPNQNIELRFGSISQFDGMTSFDSDSNTSGISQDGYPGGDLSGIRVDETGTLIGSFTNGRSFGLAQVAMAKFTNNEGLESDGGNTFIQTSNSGDPVIGSASSGGRGFIQASSLEMSNVDLSRSLTQLIVIQRGYQANSKTITTSDQMLNTLLQLKQKF